MQWVPPGEAVTTYSTIGEDPEVVGGDQLTFADVSLTTAETLLGAEGTSFVVMGAALTLKGLVPTEEA
jgi:hypothetical protein